MRESGILLTAIIVFLMSACTNIGPRTSPRDRFDYNAAISDSWKEQTLLNIVKTRYADMPLFVEVASVVSGYTLESSVNIGASQSSNTVLEANRALLGGSTKYTDRPTITYAPITGSRFSKSFMTPIPPKAVLFLVQSGGGRCVGTNWRRRLLPGTRIASRNSIVRCDRHADSA